jgi:hypothetical protein
MRMVRAERKRFMHASIRAIACAAVAVPLLATAAPALAQPAGAGNGAALGALTCLGTESVSYSPGITNTPQPVTFTTNDTFGPCLVPGQPTLTGGSATSTGQAVKSCLELKPGASPENLTETYHWNDQTQSQVQYSTLIILQLPTGQIQIVQEGTVQSGPGAGDIATETITLVSLDLTACETPQGLQTVAGPVTLAFL